MPPCLTLSIINYESKVSGAVLGKELCLTLHRGVEVIEKGCFRLALNYGRLTYVYGND